MNNKRKMKKKKRVGSILTTTQKGGKVQNSGSLWEHRLCGKGHRELSRVMALSCLHGDLDYPGICSCKNLLNGLGWTSIESRC
jgi:hypothetical protein